MEVLNNIKSFSQSGQDIFLYSLFSRIGTKNKIAVEFGAKDGIKWSNIRMFGFLGWKLHQWDKIFSNHLVIQENINAENINDVFKKYNVPKQFDLLSIDIDGNDYWVWQALEYEPNVLLIEYNPNFSKDKSLSVNYDPNRSWKKNVAFGASYKAMINLGEKKGYEAVCSIQHDLIFLKKELVNNVENIDKISEPILPKHIHIQTGYNEFIEV